MPDAVKSKSPQVDALRKQLEAEKAAILAKVAPARADYERLINDPRLIEARKVIKENNVRLFEIDNELAALARAGGSRGVKAEAGAYRG